jgi:uncharacterized membrane protein (DUF485 family)
LETESADRDSLQQARRPYRARARRRARLSVGIVVMLFVWLVVLGAGEVVLSTLIPDVRRAYARDIVDTGKEPAFLLTLAFLLTFGVVRLITYRIHYQRARLFRNVSTKSGLHIHHVVPGMVLVLISGYLGLVLTGHRPTELLAVLFGIGAALVLDEFALLLRLADVYWEPEGRESIDAVVLAGGVCLWFLLGLGFWPHLVEAVFGSVLSHR